MMNSNWMVKLAIYQRNQLVKTYGKNITEVDAMSLAETTKELKKLGHDFKKNSPFVKQGNIS